MTFEAIGVPWCISTRPEMLDSLRARILGRIARFDASYSRFRPDSLVSRMAMAEGGGSFEFPADSIPLFALYDRLHRATRGRIDPLVGSDLELLGYGRELTLRISPDARGRIGRINRRPSWTDISRSGRRLTTPGPVLVDVGAAGKGFLVDELGRMLEADGITEYMVDASGDYRFHAGEALTIGLEDPSDFSRAIGTASISRGALCASGVSRRRWRDISVGMQVHHILDAVTGLPTTGTLASWVVAEDAATADGLATALFTTSPQDLRAHFDFDFALLRSDRTALISRDFPGRIFTD